MLPKVEVSAKNILISSKELCFGVLFGFIWWPAFIFLSLLNISLRKIVQSLYNIFYPKGRFIIADGEDSVFGYKKIKGNCNSLIQGYQIIKGTPSLKVIREKFLNLLQAPETKEEYSRFQYIFTHKWGYYCWKKDLRFDIHNHIKVLEQWQWDPSKEADEEKVLDLVAQLFRTDIPPNKPQWEILLIPKYRVSNNNETNNEHHYALITRFNHGYSDAISYFLMVNNYIADMKSDLPMDPTKLPFKVPLWAQIIIWGKALILGPYNFVTIMSTFIFDSSVFRTPYYSEKKICGRSPPIPLETIRKIKKRSDTSVTAILYTAVYSALYKSHKRHHPLTKVPPFLHLGSVMAMFPYWEKRKLGNQFTLWPYTAPLPVRNNCLRERLQSSNEIIRKGMGSPGPVFNFHLTRALGSLPEIFHTLLWKLSGCPIMLSNVPGFTNKLKLYGGEMVDAAGFLPLMSTVGIGLSTQSYCGDLRFNCVVDPQVFSRRADLQAFLDDITAELENLANLYIDAETDENGNRFIELGRKDLINSEKSVLEDNIKTCVKSL